MAKNATVTSLTHSLNAKNFAVFFYVHDEYNEVYILNIIYQKRNLLKILSALYPDSEKIE